MAEDDEQVEWERYRRERYAWEAWVDGASEEQVERWRRGRVRAGATDTAGTGDRVSEATRPGGAL